MTRQRIARVAFLLILSASAVARADKTDDYIRTEMQRQRIPGLSLAVVKDGKIVKVGGYGLANIESKRVATPQTVYKIASVSKQFIASGIMLLVQQGQCGLDDAISKYLAGTPPTWKGITIRHLLTHTSGLVREAPGFDPFKIQSDADVIKSAYPLPLRFAPGEKWEYSNIGYFALAEIISTLSGRPWTEYLSENIFRPSGMNTTRPTNTKDSLPDRAQGYTDNDRLRNADDWKALRPSGAFLSTVLDMAKWDAVLNTDRILRESSRRQMWSPVTLNDGTSYSYGFGWSISKQDDHRVVQHNGGMPGFRSAFARFVDDKLSIIVLMNLDDADPDPIVRGVAALHLPVAAPIR